MNRNQSKYRKTLIVWMLFFGGCFVVLIGFVASIPYFSPDLPQLDLADANLQTYTNSEIGFSIDYPDAYQIDARDDDDGIVLNFDGANLVVISFLTREQADSRGLWADHEPTEDIELGGRPGRRYDYNHFDIFMGVHTISYVIPHENKFLAVEFRVRKASLFESFGIRSLSDRKLTDLEHQMLNSFRLID